MKQEIKLPVLNELKSALYFARLQKNRYFEEMSQLRSVLISSVDKGAKLTEEQITKTYLKDLLFKVFQYQRAFNAYNYYRDEVTKLIVKIEDLKQNGNVTDSNR